MIRVLSAVVCLFGANLAFAGALALSMRVEPVEVQAGTWPAFVVTFTNTSDFSVRVLNFANRGDLQSAYLPIEIHQGSRAVDLPRAVSDPGPLSDDAYRSIGARQSEIVRFSSLPIAIHLLEPGQYVATVRYLEPSPTAGSQVIEASASLVVRK
jgi:hypothetical protein